MDPYSYFWHIFLHKTFFQSYFLKFGVIFGNGTPNQVYWMNLMIIIASYLPPVISSTYCSFVLLSLRDIFDTRDNGSTGHRTLDGRFEWVIMTTCHLSPVTYHLCHLWPPVTSPLATMTSVTRCEVYVSLYLLLAGKQKTIYKVWKRMIAQILA